MYTGNTSAPPLFSTFAHMVPVITEISLSLEAPPNSTAIAPLNIKKITSALFFALVNGVHTHRKGGAHK